MSIILSDGTVTVSLSPDLYWSDEYAWAPVEQTTERTITGAQVVSSATRVAGRPITLSPEDDSSAWMTRAILEQLRNWAAVPAQALVLTLRGTPRDVIFRHQDAPVVDARPVVHFSDIDTTDFYHCTVRLMEI